MRTYTRSTCVLFLLILNGCTPDGADPALLDADQAKQGFPSDFKLVAHCSGIGKSGTRWHTEIEQNGSVTQVILGPNEVKRETKLSPDAVKVLFETVKRSKFFNLQTRYQPKATVYDASTFNLDIRSNGKTKHVEVKAP